MSIKPLAPIKRHIFTLIALTAFTRIYPQYLSAKVDALGLIAKDSRIFKPSLEFAFHKKVSFALAYENGKYSSGTTQINNSPPVEVYKLNGWGIMPELRLYPFVTKKPAPLGFFVGGFFRYRNLYEEYTGEDNLLTKGQKKVYANVNSQASAYNFGVDLGYKYNLDIFVMELLFGFGGSGGQWKTPNERDRIAPDFRENLSDFGNSLRLEISLGIVLPKVKREKVVMDAPSSETIEQDKLDGAQVVIYRPKKLKGFGVQYDLYAEDSLITTVSNGSYHTYYCTKPGLIRFRAKTEASNSIVIKLEKGRTYYLKCGIESGIFIGQPGFTVMPPWEGQQELEKLIRKNN